MQIYICRDGQQTGPYSLEEVKAHLGSGALVSTDLAWYEGAASWTPLSSVPGVAANTLSLSSRQEPCTAESLSVAETEPAKRPQNKTAIVIWMLFSGLFSLICVVTTLFMISGSRQTDFPWGMLITGLFLSITGICITAQLLIALRSRPPSGVCEHCKQRKPTMSVGLNRHIGAVIVFIHRSVRGHLCQQCISKVFWKYMLITALFGWWGLFSVILTPIVLINNSIVYARSRLMPTRD